MEIDRWGGVRRGIAGARESAWVGRLVPVVLFAAALALYLPRLGVPARYFFDEILHAYTAAEYAAGNADAYDWDGPCAVGRNSTFCLASNPDAAQGKRTGKYEWTHPPLGKLIIAAGIVVAGNDPFGRRLAGVVFGAIGVVVVYRLGLALTRRRAVGVVAAGLLLVDGLYFVQSRIATVDVFATVFMTGALLSFFRYLRMPPDRAVRPLLVVGACVGLGLATKWNAAYGGGVIGLVVVARLVAHWRVVRGEGATPEARAGVRAHLVGVGVGLVLVPLAIYLGAYVPFFAHGFGVADFLNLQRAMLAYHREYDSTPEYASRWWQWPLALRPAWFGGATFENGDIANVYANGNPLLYWALLPSVCWLGWRWWRARNSALLVLLIGFFGQWLPWIFIARASFVYHFLPAVPFGCLAVATVLVEAWRSKRGWRRLLAIEYGVLVVLAFAFFYPLYAYLRLADHGLELRLWLPSWR